MSHFLYRHKVTGCKINGTTIYTKIRPIVRNETKNNVNNKSCKYDLIKRSFYIVCCGFGIGLSTRKKSKNIACPKQMAGKSISLKNPKCKKQLKKVLSRENLVDRI